MRSAEDVTQQRKLTEEQARHRRHVALRADVSDALAESGSLQGVLQRCAEHMVRHLDAAFARIWTLNKENVLELVASAGMYTHLDGSHSRVPVGRFKIGLIAQEHKLYLTNDVGNDPCISDKEWARREEIVSFAGYPLTVEGRLIGVIAMFACKPLAEDTIDVLAAVADVVSQGIERKRAEERLQYSEKSLATAQRIAHIGNWDYDVAKNEAHWSDEMYRIFGFAPQQFVPSYKTFLNSVHPGDRESIRKSVRKALYEGKRYTVEYRIVRPDGEIRYIHTRYEVTHDATGRPTKLFGTLQDITERKALEEELVHRAFHDPLTDLPNRVLFMDRLEHALARAMRQENRVAVLFMDLDNFKDVNDSLGHGAGDQLLISVAGLLRETVRPGDTVARLGGDELTILLEEVADAREAIQVAERIERVLQAPLTIEGHEVFVGASIGIALSSSAQDQPEKLLSHADLAMYRAKNKGKARHEVFTPGMETVTLNRLQLASDLRRAVERGEMRVYYQPKVRLGTNLQQQEPKAAQEGRIVGMEALVRWEHPELGIVTPKDFITTAEETGLILPIGRRVLEEACRQAQAWQEQYPADPPLVMCVNLSARQFQHPELAQDIARMLREIGLDPRCLELEITESAAMEEVESTLNILRELRDLGVGLAIDDFGTGYSSLSYLKRFPVGSLKIDRSFVEGVGEDSENAVLVSGIITLAHTLGIRVIAEGVETADQASRLRRMGCDLAQGNHFSEPLPGEAAGELLARNQSTRS